LSHTAKNLLIPHEGPHPINEAISTAGGVSKSALNDNLMLKAKPSVFCAGEMLDWEAPTGGYLISACLATGKWAGLGAVNYIKSLK
jgi:predicted flavoprotein YhiN